MSKNLKIAALALLVAGNAAVFAPADVLAQTEDINQTCAQWQIDQGLCTSGLRAFVLKIMNWFLLFLGLLTTGFLVYGGFLYITSAGNDEGIQQAKKLIIYAAVGIFVVLLAAVLVNALIGIPNSTGQATQ